MARISEVLVWRRILKNLQKFQEERITKPEPQELQNYKIRTTRISELLSEKLSQQQKLRTLVTVERY